MCMKVSQFHSLGAQIQLHHVSTQAQNLEKRSKFKEEENCCNLVSQLQTIPQLSTLTQGFLYLGTHTDCWAFRFWLMLL